MAACGTKLQVEPKQMTAASGETGRWRVSLLSGGGLTDSAGPSWRKKSMRGAAARESASRADKKISLTYERAREHVKASRRQGVQVVNPLTR